MNAKTLSIAVVVVAVLCAFGERKTGGHTDGHIKIPITFKVIDASTKRPIIGANVRFLDAAEEHRKGVNNCD